MTDVLVPVVETLAVDAATAAEATSGVATTGSAGLALPRAIVDAGRWRRGNSYIESV